MIIVTTVSELRSELAQWRGAGERVALVPTMGNLHDGHMRLVSEAREQADRVVVSIFVNPLQFGDGEDLGEYPRTLQEDCAKLVAAGCDLLFSPTDAEIYPRDRDSQTRIEVPGISDLFCGASRPGHFVGVTTVVCKLCNMVQPDVAFFGEKDFQQLLIIRRMIEDLALPVEVVGVPIVREPDGLAMSSRNGFLNSTQRQQATAIHQTLNWMKQQMISGVRDFSMLEGEGRERLASAGLMPDFVCIRRVVDLMSPLESDRKLVILAAAYLGQTRLIDNLQLTI